MEDKGASEGEDPREEEGAMSVATLIDYPNRVQDRYANLKLREIIDHLNAVKPSVVQNTNSVNQLATQVQQLTQNITQNISQQGVPASKGGSGATSLVGTHGQRLNSVAAQYPVGSLFFESDRSVFYVVENLGGGPGWRYAGGVYGDVRANYPSDVGSNDTGFLFFVEDYAHLARWDGTAWRLTDGGGGYIVDSVVALSTGWQLCDGTPTDYVLNNTTNLAVAAFTTPNEGGSLVHHRSNTAYTGTIHPVTLPTFTGTAGTTGDDAPYGGTDVAPGGTTPVAGHPHQHPFTPAGTIALPGDPVVTMDVLRYFRR